MPLAAPFNGRPPPLRCGNRRSHMMNTAGTTGVSIVNARKPLPGRQTVGLRPWFSRCADRDGWEVRCREVRPVRLPPGCRDLPFAECRQAQGPCSASLEERRTQAREARGASRHRAPDRHDSRVWSGSVSTGRTSPGGVARRAMARERKVNSRPQTVRPAREPSLSGRNATRRIWGRGPHSTAVDCAQPHERELAAWVATALRRRGRISTGLRGRESVRGEPGRATATLDRKSTCRRRPVRFWERVARLSHSRNAMRLAARLNSRMESCSEDLDRSRGKAGRPSGTISPAPAPSGLLRFRQIRSNHER